MGRHKKENIMIENPSKRGEPRKIATNDSKDLSGMMTSKQKTQTPPIQVQERKKVVTIADSTVEEKLKALFKLQQIDSKIDKIKIVRGELPLEIEDLEDEIKGLETRIKNFNEEISELEKAISEKQNAIKDTQLLIKKYEKQLMNVRNNREYESLSKEIEFQNLEIKLCEKRINEYKASIKSKKDTILEVNMDLKEKKDDYINKKGELDEIINETQKDEEKLSRISQKNEKIIEERLLYAYKKIRNNVRNKLAVVAVDRDACGGCHNKIPPQRQLEVRSRMKIIVCEYCGRILIDNDLAQQILEKVE